MGGHGDGNRSAEGPGSIPSGGSLNLHPGSGEPLPLRGHNHPSQGEGVAPLQGASASRFQPRALPWALYLPPRWGYPPVAKADSPELDGKLPMADGKLPMPYGRSTMGCGKLPTRTVLCYPGYEMASDRIKRKHTDLLAQVNQAITGITAAGPAHEHAAGRTSIPNPFLLRGTIIPARGRGS